ncbi:MAG: TolB-like 6-bladed beta-propeller domain-containing protein [Prevotellaceae bacterium]|jgi:hypothetical protein|nr:TolB-like 6-bladed beta-propeller domain-containing protein [Prevotellaceae bacterium]
MISQIKKLALLVIPIITVLASCDVKNADKIVEIQLSESKAIQLERKVIDVSLYRPNKIYLYNDNLIVYDDIRDSIFKVLDNKDLKHKYTFGRIGQGPGEFIFVDNEAINSSAYFEILNRNELRYYNITDTVAVQALSPKSIVHKSGPINNFKKLSDSIYLLNNDHTSGKFEKELISYNINNKTETEFGDLILFGDLKSKNIEEQYFSLSKSITANTTRDKFALFYYMYPFFKIFSSGTLSNVFHINDKTEHAEGCAYFASAYSTDKFIYVLWVLKSEEEIMENLDNYKPVLLVFDWDGNLVQNYKFDVPIITFAVNNSNDKLYGISIRESDMNAIYVCNIQVNK